MDHRFPPLRPAESSASRSLPRPGVDLTTIAALGLILALALS